MLEWAHLPEWLKLSPRHLLPIALVTGFLTFAGGGPIDTLGLQEFRRDYRGWIGIVFLSSSGILASHLCFLSWEVARTRRDEARADSARRRRMLVLSTEERRLLSRFILHGTKTINLDISSGVVNGLVAGRVIYRASDVGQLDRWAFNIQPWAWEYLHEHPELVLGPEDLVAFHGSNPRAALPLNRAG